MSITLTDALLTYPDGDTRLCALDHVNFAVDRSKLVAVTGPSGSGKSSLLAVAGLLITPESGTVHIGGVDVTGLSRSERTTVRREQLGFVFQQSNLLASLTATEQLQLITHLGGGRVRSVRSRARDLLASLGLEKELDRRPHQLSGGQRQRVAIARSLMNDPSVLLVDEPTSALDEDRSREIVALLANLSRERDVAVVMVTHDLGQLDLVDDVYEMHSGRLTRAQVTA
ncbi:ABC transporter ATP-binding protein [Rhodococcus tukisamuensis]|uniref:Putative ABC transport system ATP-binding protein n=1 Tax=Rhodococcus tukisamuensis TaxID=168276 RepID=A0A1G7CAK5_9NOCA|nr:ABC transporter ATP-binding protein [Rhodococcus tukisamuensis]SDE36412.1 putative ABC transport system ATP-binding protein [Rhodococcus tukisamuensis]